MLPICYESGLIGGHPAEAAQLVSLATEAFIKDALSTIFGRVQSNPPGSGGGGALGAGPLPAMAMPAAWTTSPDWIRTHKYKQQVAREEQAAARGELARDEHDLLPTEARAANEWEPLGMADLRLALELGDFGLAQFPAMRAAIVHGYHEGELEDWNDYSFVPGAVVDGGQAKRSTGGGVGGGGGGGVAALAADTGSEMDVDGTDEAAAWEGPVDGWDLDAEAGGLDNMLDSCLAAAS